MSFKGIQERAREPERLDTLACTFCGKPTARETLTSYGARCGACFGAYVRESRGWPDVPSSLGNDARSWVKRLEYRRDVLGERLSRAQTDALERVKAPEVEA